MKGKGDGEGGDDLVSEHAILCSWSSDPSDPTTQYGCLLLGIGFVYSSMPGNADLSSFLLNITNTLQLHFTSTAQIRSSDAPLHFLLHPFALTRTSFPMLYLCCCPRCRGVFVVGCAFLYDADEAKVFSDNYAV